MTDTRAPATGHTPAPWRAVGGTHIVASHEGVEDIEVARVALWRPDDTEANTHLIAAAPELLAELRELLAHALAMDRRLIEITDGREDPAFLAICERVDAVLAKATGGAS